jgi:predicted  nucleic acid-binding Zn-ribbon protein
MGDFLEQLENSKRTLEGLHDEIAQSIEKKQKFTASIKQKLTEINTQVQTLVATMQNLRDRILGLQKEIADNSGSIGANQTRIQELEQQNAQVQQEKTALEQQMQALQTQHEGEKAKLVANITQLQQEEAMLKKQIEDLNQTIQNNGTQQQDQHAKQLAELQAECQKRMDENAAQIQTLTQQLQDLTQNTTDQLAQKEARIAELQTKEGQNDKQIADLTAEVARLTALNANLEGSIKGAIDALNNASIEIRKLIDAGPNDADQGEIERMLEGIKKSIDDINAAIPPGAGPAPPRPTLPAPPNIDPSIEITLSGKTYNLQGLANILYQKSLEKGAHPKFARALAIITANPNDNASIEKAFNSIRVSNGPNKGLMVTGGKTRTSKKHKKAKNSGKKTKKIRKQKGGYTYKDTKTGGFIVNKTKKNKRSTHKSKSTSSRKTTTRKTTGDSINF